MTDIVKESAKLWLKKKKQYKKCNCDQIATKLERTTIKKKESSLLTLYTFCTVVLCAIKFFIKITLDSGTKKIPQSDLRTSDPNIKTG
jgi:hypothetical protein